MWSLEIYLGFILGHNRVLILHKTTFFDFGPMIASVKLNHQNFSDMCGLLFSMDRQLTLQADFNVWKLDVYDREEYNYSGLAITGQRRITPVFFKHSVPATQRPLASSDWASAPKRSLGGNITVNQPPAFGFE